MNAPTSTQARSMHFAMFIPDWNSLDSVRRAHSDLEFAALVFFAFLVLFDILAQLSKSEKKKTLLEKIGLCFFAVAVVAEIAAYPYGQRNDSLSGQIIGSLDAKAREAAANASQALSDSTHAELNSQTAIDKSDKATKAAANSLNLARGAQEMSGDAETSARQISTFLAPRILTAKEQTDLTAALRDIAAAGTNSEVPIKLIGAALSGGLTEDIRQALEDAGFKKVEVELRNASLGYGLSVSAPRDDLPAAGEIGGRLSKYCPIMGFLGESPAGSPILIVIGDVPGGPFPGTTKPQAVGKDKPTK